MVVNAVIPVLWRLRQKDLKFHASLSYIVSSRLACTTEWGGGEDRREHTSLDKYAKESASGSWIHFYNTLPHFSPFPFCWALIEDTEKSVPITFLIVALRNDKVLKWMASYLTKYCRNSKDYKGLQGWSWKNHIFSVSLSFLICLL